jgi:Polyketide cyclase / dehydrase and lipid transport
MTASPPTPARAPTAVAEETYDVPAAVVWQYRLDFINLPEYNPDVSGVIRVAEGDPSGPWGVLGPGARYTFRLADPRQSGASQPVELWPVTVEEPTLVAAAMTGASDAYEEFTVRSTGEGGCEATLTLWVTLPPEFADNQTAKAASAASGYAQISKELRLMKAVLEERARRPATA